MARTAKINDIVKIQFLDHAAGESPIDFTVYGRVEAIDKKSITIQSWGYTDPEHTETLEDDKFNIEQATIVRAAVLKLTVLERAQT